MFYFLIKETRYYKINLQKTLFDSYEVERIYGNQNYKNPTGKKINIFENKIEAIKFIERLVRIKTKQKKYCIV